MPAIAKRTAVIAERGGVAAAGEQLPDMPKLSRSTLNEEVYEELKQAMMAGRITPGSTMTIRSLADSFGISVMPVREALRRLVAEHVLILLPNRTVALPVFTRERFHELTRMRVALEGLAAEEGAPNVSADGIAHMSEMTRLMEKDAKRRAADVLEWNREFHFSLYRFSGMPTLVKTIESLWLQVGPLLNIHQETFSRGKTSVYVHHHRAIEGIRRHKPEMVRQAIAGDIEDAAKTIGAKL